MSRLRSIFYTTIRSVCRLAARIFYRRIEFIGSGTFPEEGPVLALGNHGNALIDPMLLLAFLPRRFHFLAKSTFWKSPGWRVLMEMAGAIPVYRQQDAGSDTGRNSEMFAACHEVLAAEGAIAMFPEGLSHDEPSLQPLKTGAARIALEAQDRHSSLTPQIVPIGLIFEEAHTFRSSLLMRIGTPFDLGDEFAGYRDDPRQAVRDSTQRIAAALQAVTMNYSSWSEARLLELAADIYSRPDLELPTRQNLAARVRMRRAFYDRYQELTERAPERLDGLSAELEAYDLQLGFAGVDDEQVAATYPIGPFTRFVAREAALLVVELPVALIGLALNWLPYKIPGWVTRWAGQPRNQVATYKVIISLVLFPLIWTIEAWAGSRWLGVPYAAFGILILAPLSGWINLRFFERFERFLGEVRAFLLVRSRSAVAAELSARRSHLLARLIALEPGREAQRDAPPGSSGRAR